MDKALIISDIKKYLNFKKDTELAEYLGLKQNTLSTWKSRNTMDYDLIISKCDFINANWLITGKGEMLLRNSNNDPMKEINQPNLIPFFDGVAVGGTNEVANMDPSVQANEYINAGDWFKDATAAMRVHGDSMAPEYKPGSIVALKNVNDKRLIVYGQDYVVETSEYRVIKRLQRSDFNDCWSCYSINNETYTNSEKLIHEPFDVPVDAVNRLYRVLGNVTRTESSRIVLNSY